SNLLQLVICHRRDHISLNTTMVTPWTSRASKGLVRPIDGARKTTLPILGECFRGRESGIVRVIGARGQSGISQLADDFKVGYRGRQNHAIRRNAPGGKGS